MFHILDLLGTASFAISGALTAMNKKMDTFGVFIIAFATAVGGGTLRDILIDRNPVTWMSDLTYVYIIFISVIIAIIFRKKIGYLSKSLFLFDTIGLGIFTIVGTEIGIQNDLHPLISISLGMMTATFGGVIRDILINEIPIIFHKEIYATACIIGSLTYILLNELPIHQDIKYIITTLIVISIRLVAVRFKLKLPTFYTNS
ncbi:MAG: trimeric intracellular cation channel family protein [Bacteroidota bacterium]